jgi:alpha-L-fucosidase
MADYSIAKMIVAKKDTASIECFFTQKNKDIFCIIPSYRSKLLLKDIKLPASAKASLLGAPTNIGWKQQGSNVMIDLSAIKPGDISPSGIFVIKLAGITT